MAQNVLIAGALFSDVPSISVPDQSNNWHSYVDTSDANATAGDILNGKTAYINGVKLTGNMPSGSAATPATTITANPTISVNASGLITASVSKTQGVTPTVSAGYVASGTSGTITVNGSNTNQLTAKSAQTYTPTTTDQTIASGQYLTGVQTVKGDANLLAENIKKDVVLFGTTGTYEGSGGGSSWTRLIASTEVDANITTSSVTTVTTLDVGSSAYTKDKILWVHIRDKAGPRSGYFYGTDAFFINANKANNTTSVFNAPSGWVCKYSGTKYSASTGQYGVYGSQISDSGILTIRGRYNSSYTGTINGTYIIDVYLLELPSGLTLFS